MAPVQEGARAPRDDGFRGQRGGGPREPREGGHLETCSICTAMGDDERAKTHRTDFCYLNQKSPYFRPGLWKFRVMALLKASLPVPAVLHRDGYTNGIRDGGPEPPAQKEARQGGG